MSELKDKKRHNFRLVAHEKILFAGIVATLFQVKRGVFYKSLLNSEKTVITQQMLMSAWNLIGYQAKAWFFDTIYQVIAWYLICIYQVIAWYLISIYQAIALWKI